LSNLTEKLCENSRIANGFTEGISVNANRVTDTDWTSWNGINSD